MKDAKGHGSDSKGAAHQEGVGAASKGLFTDAQIMALKSGYSGISTVDPMQPTYGKLTALLDKATPEQLKQLSGAGIKFVSNLARNRLPDTDKYQGPGAGGAARLGGLFGAPPAKNDRGISSAWDTRRGALGGRRP